MKEIILTVIDYFQLEGRGSVVTGIIGDAWSNAKAGDMIAIHTPAGTQFVTAIKEKELFRGEETSKNGGLLMTDSIDLEQAPRGSLIVPWRC